MYGEGISKTGEIIDLAVKSGIIDKAGAWYSYNNDRIGQGRENAKIFLKDNNDIALEIENELRKKSDEKNYSNEEINQLTDNEKTSEEK